MHVTDKHAPDTPWYIQGSYNYDVRVLFEAQSQLYVHRKQKCITQNVSSLSDYWRKQMSVTSCIGMTIQLSLTFVTCKYLGVPTTHHLLALLPQFLVQVQSCTSAPWQSMPSSPPTRQTSFQCSFLVHGQRASKHKDDAWPSLQE